MPLILLFALAVTTGLTVGIAVWRYPRLTPGSPTLAIAREIGETAESRPRLRALADARLDPAAATGLALTFALVIAIGGGVLLGVLAYLVRTNSFLTGIDNGVAKWGYRHASPSEMHVLNDVTQLGSIYTVVALCVCSPPSRRSGSAASGSSRLSSP